MRRSVPLTFALLSLAACGTTRGTGEYSDFAQPNQLMAEEIQNRIGQIPFQHRGELYDNLIWLSQRGEQAIPALTQGLRHAEPKVRSNCAFVLATIGDRRALPYLQAASNDSNEVVRLEVSRSLVQMGDLKYAPALIEGLDSERAQVRYYCHETLRAATGRDFGYDHLTEDVTTRRQAILGWRKWWSEQTGDRFFASEYAQRNQLTTEAPAQPIPAAPQMEPMPIPQPANQDQGWETEPKVTPLPAPNVRSPLPTGETGETGEFPPLPAPPAPGTPDSSPNSNPKSTPSTTPSGTPSTTPGGTPNTTPKHERDGR